MFDTDLSFSHLDTDQTLQIEARLIQVRQFIHGESRVLSTIDESLEALQRELNSRSARDMHARTRTTSRVRVA